MRQLRFLSIMVAVVAALLLSSCGDSGGKPSAPQTFSMGERVTLGHLVYTVFETQWLTHLGEGVNSRLPQNRFFLVRMSAVNGYGSSVIVPNLSIEDDNGNTFQELSSGDGVPQYIGYLRSVRPAESAQGNALFDAPPRHYKLKLADESGEKIGYVDIPLNFGPENAVSPPMPEPDGKKK